MSKSDSCQQIRTSQYNSKERTDSSGFAIRNRLQTLLFMRQKATVQERSQIDDEVMQLRLQLQRI